MIGIPAPAFVIIRCLLAAILLGMAVMSPLAAWAGSLQASPILLEFTPQQSSQALWLTNTGTAPLRAQVRVQQWTQSNGSEYLSPTRELAASPALLEIGPGERQLVRIVVRQPATGTDERAYRLIVDELPDATAEQDGGLQFLLRYSIPVFVGGPSFPTGDPESPREATHLTDTRLVSARWENDRLSVVNHGPRRIRLSQLAWRNEDGSEIRLLPGLLGYALAGQRMEWPLPLPDMVRPGGQLIVKLNNDGEHQPLPLLPATR